MSVDNSPQVSPDRRKSYVLMTAAYNEEAFIEGTIKSVLSQTLRPKSWVIVSDGSTDNTDKIVEQYAERHQFIRFLKLNRPPGRSFGSKVLALQQGAQLLAGHEFDFIGNIDADVQVEPLYFEALIDRFDCDRMLGIGAGFVYEQAEGEFRNRGSNRLASVPHAAQLVRRECYEVIGGYKVLKYGGEDWHAQMCAKMNGWKAQSFPELRIFHQRHTGSATNLLFDRFRLGRLDYSLGSDPFFELFKCAQRIAENPILFGCLARLAGFFWSALVRDGRPVSKDFVRFLRAEQRSRLRALKHAFRKPRNIVVAGGT